MAAGCCGTKKQKLNNCSVPMLNPPINGVLYGNSSKNIDGNYSSKDEMVVTADMCFFCFDVLFCYLNQYEPPKAPPNFPSEN